MKNCVNDHTCSEELDPLVRGGCIPLTMGVEQSRAPEMEEVDGRSPPSFFKALLKIVSRLRLYLCQVYVAGKSQTLKKYLIGQDLVVGQKAG